MRVMGIARSDGRGSRIAREETSNIRQQKANDNRGNKIFPEVAKRQRGAR